MHSILTEATTTDIDMLLQV